MLCVNFLDNIFRIVRFRDFSIQKYTQCYFMNALVQSLLASHFWKRILCSFSLSPVCFTHSPTYSCEMCVCAGVYMRICVMYIERVHTARSLEKVWDYFVNTFFPVTFCRKFYPCIQDSLEGREVIQLAWNFQSVGK